MTADTGTAHVQGQPPCPWPRKITSSRMSSLVAVCDAERAVLVM